MGYFRKGHPGIFTLEKNLAQSPANHHTVAVASLSPDRRTGNAWQRTTKLIVAIGLYQLGSMMDLAFWRSSTGTALPFSVPWPILCALASSPGSSTKRH